VTALSAARSRPPQVICRDILVICRDILVICRDICRRKPAPLSDSCMSHVHPHLKWGALRRLRLARNAARLPTNNRFHRRREAQQYNCPAYSITAITR